uniref:Lipase n=1 Tax=Strongyloides stercoralis TaxID=6248 RepID=A0A0K0ET00_STRER
MVKFITRLWFSIILFQVSVEPLTMDFRIWLHRNGYSDDDFEAKNFGNNGSFGGKGYFNYIVRRRPVIFIHGNSDGALSDGSIYGTGWNSHLKGFLNNGYTAAELYGITWGDRNPNNAFEKTFNCEFVNKIRRFILAVLKYTRYNSVNIVSHSMGVTLTRKAIQGGIINGIDGSCDIGEYLKGKVNTFVAISGANYGLCFCNSDFFLSQPGCNKKNGFWPGDNYHSTLCSDITKNGYHPTKYSQFLQDLNDANKPEGKFITTVFSTEDELIGNKNKVFNRYTSSLPLAGNQYISNSWNHTETKDNSSFLVCKEIMNNDLKINHKKIIKNIF